MHKAQEIQAPGDSKWLDVNVSPRWLALLWVMGNLFQAAKLDVVDENFVHPIISFVGETDLCI